MTGRSIPVAALKRLGEIVPISMSTAHVAKIADWAAELVEKALAEAARADLRASGVSAPETPVPAVVAADRPAAEAAPRGGGVSPTPPPTPAQPPAAGAAWSDDEIAMLTELVAQGFTASGIAVRLGRTTAAVASRLAAMRHAGALPPARPRTGPAWTPAADAELLRRVAAGERGQALADAIGRTVRAVEMRLVRLRKTGAPVAPRPMGRTLRGRAAGGRAADAAPEIAPATAPRSGVTAAASADHANGKGPRVHGHPSAPAPKPAPAPPVAARTPAAAAAPAPALDDPQDDDTDFAVPDCVHRIAADISAPLRPVVQRAMAHLDRVPPDPRLDPCADLRLLVETLQGVPSVHLAPELGLTPQELGKRFRRMVPGELRDNLGRVSLDGTRVLLEAAKRNAVAG